MCPDNSLEPFLVAHDGIFVQVVNILFNRPVVFDRNDLKDERLIGGRLGELLQALHKVALLFAFIVGRLVTFFKGVVPEVFVETPFYIALFIFISLLCGRVYVWVSLVYIIGHIIC